MLDTEYRILKEQLVYSKESLKIKDVGAGLLGECIVSSVVWMVTQIGN